MDEIVIVDLYLLGSDVGPVWPRGLKETSVSIGCEIRKLGKGDEICSGVSWSVRCRDWNRIHGYFSLCISLTLLAVSVGLRCGTIMVARIRRKFCQYRVCN